MAQRDNLESMGLGSSRVINPHLHILIVGAGKVGKSCILCHALGHDYQTASYPISGQWNIAPGLTSLRNPRFVLHELLNGQNAQKSERLHRLQEFLTTTGSNEPVEDRPHVIWLCVQIPFTRSHGGFDAPEAAFLAEQEVPVIVIFTQFDRLVDKLSEELSLPDNSTDEAAEQLTVQRAHVQVRESCLDPLNEISPRLPYAITSGLNEPVLVPDSQQSMNNLLQTTRRLAEEYVESKLWSSSGIPQHLAGIPGKLDTSIQIGMNVYYRVLFCHIWWCQLESIFDKLHRDTTRTWNLDDPLVRRDSVQFVSEVRTISSVSTTDWDPDKLSWPNLLDRYQILITFLLGTTVTATLGRVAASLAVCLCFAHIFMRMQQRLPETVRSFLEYIIHLTILLERIFRNSVTSPQSGRPHPLTEADIRRALEEYQGSEAAAQVHSEVQLFVDDACQSLWRMCRGLNRRRAEELVRGLVQRWRVDVQNGLLSAAEGR
ncbi:hypothetical protein C8F01DRAFT_676120 [Mycena amicta]|nr:hypothetical protein C8F01DRAFT_676120 [Mycena amicta]